MSMDPAAGTGISSCGVVDPPAGARAGAGKVPMAVSAVAPGAVELLVPVAVVAASPAGAAAAAKPALNWQNLRRRWAQALFIFGCAEAALGFLSINSSSPTADSRRLLGACAPTETEAATALQNAWKYLVVFAAAQVLAATTALLVPASRQVAIFLSSMGLYTGFDAARVLLMLFQCHGRDDTMVTIYYSISMVVVTVGYFAGSVIVKSSY